MSGGFRDKQGGLIVDDLGLADQLKQPLATYTERSGHGSPRRTRHQRVPECHYRLDRPRLSPSQDQSDGLRRILKKYGYAPALQVEATKLVLEQAEGLRAAWAT